MKHLSLCLLLVVVLAGCAGVSARIKSRPAAYAALSQSDQSLVTLGKIREGFSPDAVYLAWGRQDQTVRGSSKGKAFETWVYLTTDQQAVISTPILPTRGLYGPYDLAPIYEPLYVTRLVPYRSATFQGGHVVQWSDTDR